MGFEKEEADLIIDLLVEGNYVLPSGDFTTEQIDYFLDINNALKAECIMLNKGPYILEVIQFLDEILRNEESFQNKNETMLPELKRLK